MSETITGQAEVTTPEMSGTSEASIDTTAETTQQGGNDEALENSENIADGEGGSNGENEVAEGADDTDDDGQGEQPFVTVKFNKGFQNYTAEEAKPLIQMGLNYQRLSPVLEQAKILAAENNQSMQEFIGELYQAHEQMQRERYMDASGGDEELVERMMQQQKQQLLERSGQIDKPEADENDSDYVEQLANEFMALQKDFPEFEKFSDLPPEVLQTAQQNNISLLDAKLRLDYASRKAANAAKKQQKKNSGAALGSAGSGNGSGDNDISALMKGIWG